MAGEFIKTGDQSTAILTTEGDSQLKLRANTELQLSDPKTNEVFLRKGELFSKIIKGSETHFHVKTSTAVMGVRGTQFYTSYGEEKHKGDVLMCVNEGLGVFAPEPKLFGWTKELN